MVNFNYCEENIDLETGAPSFDADELKYLIDTINICPTPAGTKGIMPKIYDWLGKTTKKIGVILTKYTDKFYRLALRSLYF